jgi:hypothetical protein
MDELLAELLLAADRDHLVPAVEQARLASRMPNATIRVLPATATSACSLRISTSPIFSTSGAAAHRVTRDGEGCRALSRARILRAVDGREEDHRQDVDESEIDEPLPDETRFLEEGDEEPEEPPVPFWTSVRDAARGLTALLALSIAVLMVYIVGGVFVGLLTWAAPAILAIAAAVILARYLSRGR